MASLVNALIGEYRVTNLLGVGGMGEVYKATHTHLGRIIAVKVLLAGEAAPETVRRFYSEANIQASLRHPGVAEYLGFYEYQGRPCILMEYVDGETLSSMLQRKGALPAEEVFSIARALTAVVAHFHQQDVLHRDIKTSNVKITSDGTVKVLDFGIARFQKTNNLTRTGMVVGTPGILAPEQLRSETVTPATDVWQLGVLMYEMLTAQMPFEADDIAELYAQILNAKFEPISKLRPSLPTGLEKIVNRCLQKDPSRRFASSVELLAALDALDQVRPASASVPRMKPFAFRQLPLKQAGAIIAGAVVIIAITMGGIRVVRAVLSSPPEGMSRTPCVVPSSSDADPSVEMKTVPVNVSDGLGEAQVLCDGQKVGKTPYEVRGKIGDEVNLLLRRAGFKDQPVQFIVGQRPSWDEPMYPLEEH